MKMGVTEPEELEMLKKYAPDLFVGTMGQLLYVGANQLRPPHHANTLFNAGWHLDLLEIFPGNIEHHRRGPLFRNIILGDVRTAPIADNRYDIVMWWHGIEHIPKQDAEMALANLERWAADLVVLGCPNGDSPQGPEYGNDAEIHQWSVYPGDLESFGYEVEAYECVGRRHLLAWKHL